MDKQRLLAIADLIDTIPKDQFDMYSWSRKTSCGTVGCAIGHAIAQGLLPELKLYQIGKYLYPLKRGADLEELGETAYLNAPMEAIADTLGISFDNAEDLFDPERYDPDDEEDPDLNIGTKTVSSRIRAFVAERS